MRLAVHLLGMVLMGLLTTSCATTQSRYRMLGQPYPSRTEECQIEVFRTGGPSRAYVQISRIDVHLEKTHFISSSLESTLPELKRQACLSGADAIMDIQEQSSSYLETRMYHVTAIGIKYQE
jgi:hypothetical protein